ncbi:MAG: hypothetical protein HOU81_13935 [Hamadaea sp.]|uniref:hypothetical protein n=1 Tax=Hamadaea sp. TaxID=2024425 RepID=UPI0017E6A471|nr:hypothetical protein [Hamadaea sp.]NUR71917.1 hypothetical protein [Hamadaea sp.]NUT18220.1 hypothetical protein [Hamadaea sp.]
MISSEQFSHAGVSLRLEQVLRVYAHDLDPHTLADLRAAIAAGRHGWFHDEFAQAVRDGAYAAEDWCAAVGTRAEPALAEQQRVVWSAVFPDDPFPVRTPTA